MAKSNTRHKGTKRVQKNKVKKSSNKTTKANIFGKKKVGLALGGGSAKGIAHIGVLKVLEKNGIKVDMMAGSSMGALISGLYCVHQDADKVEKIIEDFDLRKYVDIGFSISGLIPGRKLETILKKILNDSKFEDLKIPLFISSTDFLENREVVFNSGDLSLAVRSSISMPGLLTPIKMGKKILVDGSMKNPLPVDILKENGCDIIIAVNLDAIDENKREYATAKTKKSKGKMPNLIDVSIRSYEIMEREVVKLRRSIEEADILIEPKVSSSDFFKFNKPKDLIRKGELATEKQIRKIKRTIRRSSL